ncbi:MAG: metallophosphoesterase family protein [Actinomycetota bacterium]|nr:metallophosphoesterase family protein [Actinomycetota bacterium]
MRVIVLADTHLRGGIERLPALVREDLSRCDAIVHAGDVVDDAVLAALARHAPLHAVAGNNDAALCGQLPGELVIELAGVSVAVVHDAGPRPGRDGRLRRRFPDAEVVVYGHSHIPDNHLGTSGQLVFNPGSPTQRRRQPSASYGELVLGAGRLVGHRIITLAAA